MLAKLQMVEKFNTNARALCATIALSHSGCTSGSEGWTADLIRSLLAIIAIIACRLSSNRRVLSAHFVGPAKGASANAWNLSFLCPKTQLDFLMQFDLVRIRMALPFDVFRAEEWQVGTRFDKAMSAPGVFD